MHDTSRPEWLRSSAHHMEPEAGKHQIIRRGACVCVCGFWIHVVPDQVWIFGP